jgi:hypothetical protein
VYDGFAKLASGCWLFLCAVLRGANDGPTLSAGDIVSAADPSSGRVAPGEIVVLYPRNAGAAVLQGAQIDGEGIVTTLLGETRVWFDGIAHPPLPMTVNPRVAFENLFGGRGRNETPRERVYVDGFYQRPGTAPSA